MNINPPVRPNQAINRLLEMLEPYATPMNVVARKRLTPSYKGKTQLYLLKKVSYRSFVLPTNY